ncbi:MFS transporter [Streptomyces sp. NPDC053542]|uniref:MFS transporter n=1 Tax=Streptomyces sp. NPDC053542 TaxID=3365710 RepID=UPI0037D1D903
MPVRLYLLAAGTFFLGTDVFVIAGMLPGIGHSLGTTLAAAGQLMTAFSLAYAVLGPLLSGALGNRAPRTTLTAALCAAALGNLVCAGADSLLVAMAGRVLVAAGACQFTPQVAALAAALVPEDRQGRALALVNSGLVMGSVLGVPAGTWAASAFGWRPTLVALALGTAAVGLGLVRGLRGIGTVRPAVGARERLAALRGPGIRAVLAVTVCAVIAEYSVLTYAGAVFADATGGDGTRLAVLLLAFGLGGMAGNAFAGAYMDRPAGRRLVLISVVGMAVNFLAMPWAVTSFPTALASMVLWGVTGWMYAAPQQHRLLRLAGPAGPLAVSMNSSVIYVGAALGGATGGLLLSLLSPLDGRWIALPAAAVCALALLPEAAFHRALVGARARVQV